MKGYLKNPESTGESLSGGWFHTGDLGVQHADGYIELKSEEVETLNMTTHPVEFDMYYSL